MYKRQFLVLRFFIILIVLDYFIVVGIIFVLEGNKLFINHNSDSRTPNKRLFTKNRRNGEYMGNFLYSMTKKVIKFLFFLKYWQVQKLFQIHLRRHLYYE